MTIEMFIMISVTSANNGNDVGIACRGRRRSVLSHAPTRTDAMKHLMDEQVGRCPVTRTWCVRYVARQMERLCGTRRKMLTHKATIAASFSTHRGLMPSATRQYTKESIDRCMLVLFFFTLVHIS